ncbi:MAG: dephospho-CoA kinase [Candidatus Omnitrophica bacterium]|nr:dephospho-CoA kinase [Candidatus Omnitrophota bacterium]MBU4478795.1 dephospho-CoA kinase [Candidatus Omnitrophota bacterium]
MIVIGLTGGIASGKTVTAKMFRRRGVRVLNADTIAHRALYKNASCYAAIVRAFGKSILGPGGAISRKRLADIAFAGKENYDLLCSIVYPRLFGDIEKKIKEYRRQKSVKAVVVEAAILIESGFYRRVDVTLLVRAPEKLCRMRLMKNKRMSLLQVIRRMKFQLPLREKNKYADYVIDNSGDLKYTKQQVEMLWKRLTEVLPVGGGQNRPK